MSALASEADGRPGKIRIAVAEDQRMIRELLQRILARERDLEVVSQAGTGMEAIALAKSERPDVLLLDIGLPDMGGAEVARAVRRAIPAIKLLALSVHAERSVVQEMLRAGADGYVVKGAGLDELVQALRAVAQGKVYLSPEITREALAEEISDTGASLGSRERQVLALLADGKRSSDIAAELKISTATVEAHRRNIMRKLGLHTIAQLTKYAIRKGLTSL